MVDTGRIDRFSGKYRFLSNFYPSPILILGIEYPTVEHAYQCAKATRLIDHEKVLSSRTPGEAKRRGRKIAQRADFEMGKVKLMAELVKKKFTQHPDLGQRLLDTYPNMLIEGNTWGDRFWGVCRGRGDNQLGLILMDVREALRRANTH